MGEDGPYYDLAEQDDEITILRAELAAKDGIITNLNERSAQYERELAEAKARIAGLEADRDFARTYWMARAEDAQRDRSKIIAELCACSSRAERAERAEAEVKRLMGLLDSEEMDVLIQQERAERAEASHEQQVIVAANYAERAERAEAEVAEAKEQAHYANGVADLAMKHRDSAEAERDAMRDALEQIESILVRGDKSVSYMLMKAHAALAPSPAGRRRDRPLPEMRCDCCDNGIDDEWDFCPFCGHAHPDTAPSPAGREE